MTFFNRVQLEGKTRQELLGVTSEAIARLVSSKGDLRVLPPSFGKAGFSTIDETKSLLAPLERSLELDNKPPSDRKDARRTYNRKTLAYSSDPIIPTPRPFGG